MIPISLAQELKAAGLLWRTDNIDTSKAARPFTEAKSPIAKQPGLALGGPQSGSFAAGLGAVSEQRVGPAEQGTHLAA